MVIIWRLIISTRIQMTTNQKMYKSTREQCADIKKWLSHQAPEKCASQSRCTPNAKDLPNHQGQAFQKDQSQLINAPNNRKDYKWCQRRLRHPIPSMWSSHNWDLTKLKWSKMESRSKWLKNLQSQEEKLLTLLVRPLPGTRIEKRLVEVQSALEPNHMPANQARKK